jgi:hypothetical protein
LLLGVQRQLLDPLTLHCPTQLALDERLQQKRQEVDGEKRLDPSRILGERPADRQRNSANITPPEPGPAPGFMPTNT